MILYRLQDGGHIFISKDKSFLVRDGKQELYLYGANKIECSEKSVPVVINTISIDGKLLIEYVIYRSVEFTATHNIFIEGLLVKYNKSRITLEEELDRSKYFAKILIILE